MAKFEEIKKCVVCKKSDSLKKYLDFGTQPLANSYHYGMNLEYYPLAVQFCEECCHTQLTASVDPKEMFENYLYISDTSKTLTSYFESLCEKILARNEPNKLDVLEIACNSGLFLEMLAKKGMNCFGVDPAINLRDLSKKRNLDVLVDFWNEDTAEKLSQEKTFDIICAIHVLPHVPDPVAFLRACKKVMRPDGKIYIQTSQCNMFNNNEFDAIYHEHVSYFTATSFGRMASDLGLKITGAWKAPIHSMCFVFELSYAEENCKDFVDMCIHEIENKRNIFDSYAQFSDNAQKIKNDLLYSINNFRKRKVKVVGYGASAKGNTLLNWLGCKLDYIVDDNNLKWGHLTPGMNIPIVSPKQLYNEPSIVAIVCLAWNFFDEIHQNVVNNTCLKHKFIKYFPEVKVCD